MSRDTEPKDYAPFLRKLGSADQSYFLEGGQSVNFWAGYFQESGLVNPLLDQYRPFTSADCDIWVSKPTFEYLRREHPGELIAGNSPSDGQLGILHLGGDPERSIDLLSNVFGIPEKEIERAHDRSLLVDGVRVLDPVFLFRSKCHCLVNLDQANRQDAKHVGMLALILPAYFALLHAAALGGEINERQLIAEVKVFRRLRKDKWIRRALKETGSELESLLPVSLFTESELRTVAAFAKSIRVGPSI